MIGWLRAAVPLASLYLGLSAPLVCQVPADLARERDQFATWLASASTSPLAALIRQPISKELRLGPPDSDIPLDGLEPYRIMEQRGLVSLESSAGARPIPRGRAIRIGDYSFVVDGPADRAVLTVFGRARRTTVPQYFPFQRGLIYEGGLMPPERSGRVRILALDGTEVDASEAGSVDLPVASGKVRLRVLRIPLGGEESDLEIFFRDETNGRETYPAGRFVSLLPIGRGRYRLDFNRARNPFCAYNAAYPCPAPWKGNNIPAPIRAGELYGGGGLSAPTPEEPR